MQNVSKLLEEDNSYQFIPPNNNSPYGMAFLEGMCKKFGKKYPAQTKEREAYENGAKIYYELGFKDGQNECANVHKADNVDKDDYDFMMKLLSLMGMSYMYVNDVPLVIKEAYRNTIGQEPRMPFHPGLNLIQSEQRIISSKDLVELKAKVNEILQNNYIKTE